MPFLLNICLNISGDGMSIIKCPVCGESLIKIEKTYKCKNKHSFDISSKGYTNLILANQSFSDSSGDDKEMVLSRKEFFELDKYKCLKYKLFEVIEKYLNKEKVSFLDIACGEGYYTNFLHENLSKNHEIYTYGIDISRFAIHEANKEKRINAMQNIEYFIANLSRLPFMSDSLDLLLNCFAPIDEKEFFRVLKNEGIYIRVLPGKEHLYGLKSILYENPYFNEKKEENIDGLVLEEEIEVEDDIELESSKDIVNLFKMTPYYYKTSKNVLTKLESTNHLKTKISFLIRVYRK